MHKPGFTQHKKDPQEDQQVHDQKDAVDPRKRGIGSLGADVIQQVAVIPLTELAFDGNALQVLVASLGLFLSQRFLILFGHFLRPPQGLTGKADTAAL